MKKTRYIAVVGLLILATMLLTLNIVSCQKKKPESITYTISVLNNFGNEIDIYVHMDTALVPVLVDDNGQSIDALFDYEYDKNVVTISEHGVITPLVTEATVTEITVIELRTYTRKTFKVNIKDGLNNVGHVFDENGEKVDMSALQTFEIGESYSYKFGTIPVVVELEPYFEYVAVDEADTEKNVFDVLVKGNTITFTPTGVGEGTLRLRFKNDDEQCDVTFEVPFVISFPDEVFTQTILNSAEQSLLSVEELQSLNRLVFEENVNSFSAAKSDKLISLRTMVFESPEIVELDLENVSENMIFRVNGLELYEAYRSNEKWSNVINRIYPYMDSVTDTVIVYHNEDVYTLAGTVLSVSGVVHLNQPDTKDYQSGDGTDLFASSVVSKTEVASLQKDGYRFVGWRDEKGNAFNNEDISKISEGIHLWAVWEADSYQIILHDYNSVNGTKNQVVDTTYHQGIPSLPDGVKDGWEFKGWYLSDDYREDGKVEKGFVYDLTEGVTLYAKYEATLTFDYRGGLEDKTATVVYGKALGDLLPRHDTINGWDFCEWNTSTAYLAQNVVTANLPYVREGKETDGFSHTLYVRAEKIVSLIDSVRNDSSNIALILGLNLKDSLAVAGQSWDTYSSQYGTNETGEWAFVGWTTQDLSLGSANMLVYDAERLIQDTHSYDTIGDTVYAVYKGSLRFIHGTVGEDNYIDQTVYYGFTYEMPDAPVINSYEGYTYLGWLVDGDYVKEKTCRAVVSTAGTCVYAYYDVIAYYLHFYDEFGQEIPEKRIVFHDVGYDTTDRVLNNDIETFVGRTVDLPDVPNKDGEWTSKWELNDVRYDGQQAYTVPENVYEDQTFRAIYVSSWCKIIFDTHGYGTVSPKVVAYNTEIGTLEVPSFGPTGYQFAGWYTDKTYRTEITDETIYLYEDELTLFAKYVITVDCVGFDQTEKRSFVYGARISMADPSDMSDAVLNNWGFDGWYGAVYNYGTGEYVWRHITLADMNSFVLTLQDNKLVARWKRDLYIKPDPTDSGYFHMPDNMTNILVYRGEDFSIATPICQDGCGWSFDSWYYFDSTNEKNVCEDLFELINTTKVDTIYAQYHAYIEIHMKYNELEFVLYEGQEIVLGENINTWENFAQYMDDCQKIQGYHFGRWQIGSVSLTADAFVVEKNYIAKTWVIVLDPNTYYIQYTLDAENELLNTPKHDDGATFKQEEQVFDREFALSQASCEGYSFLGWIITVNGEPVEYEAGEWVDQLTSEHGGTVVAIAMWEPIKYFVEFNKNAGKGESDILGTVEYFYDDEVIIIGAPEREGYRFLHWELKCNDVTKVYDPDDKVGKLTSVSGVKVRFNAVWEAISYKVVFDLKGGSWIALLEQDFTYDKTYLKEIKEPSKEGYLFEGWFSNSECSGSQVGNDENLAKEAGAIVYLYAKWTPITYKIEFDCNFGQTDGFDPIFGESRIDYTYDEEYSISDPELKGYVFLGWYVEGTDTLVNGVHDTEARKYRIKNLTSENEGTVNLYAKWRPIEYKIHLDAGEGLFTEGLSDKTIEAIFAENVSLDEPKREGYTFVGWKDAEGYIHHNYASNLIATDGEVILTAVWNPVEYEIIMNANGGIFSDTGKDVVNNGYTYDSKIGVTFKEPYKKGYTLKGWARHPNAEEPEFATDYDGTDNKLFIGEGKQLTIYALWDSNPYQVIIDCAGGFYGSVSDEITSKDIWVEYEKVFTVNQVQRPWYELIGWNITVDGETSFIDKPETEFINLTDERCGVVVMQAVWAPVEYEITYCDPDGNSLGFTSKYTIESKAYNHPAVPEREHYFGIWDTSTLPTSEKDEPGDRVVTAYYAPIAYHLDYVFDGEVIKRVVYTVENTQDLMNCKVPPVPFKLGHVVEWPTVDRDAIAASLGNWTVEAVCTPIEYTLEFYEDPDGEMLSSMQVTVDVESLTLPALNGKDGYVSSWNFSVDKLAELIAGLPVGENTVRVYATHTPIRYTVWVYAPDGTYNDYAYNAEQLTDMTLKIYAALDTQTYRYVCENAQISYDDVSGYLTVSLETLGDLTVSVVPVTFDHYYTVTLEDGCETHTLIFESKDMVVTSDFYRPSKVGYEFLEWTLSAEDDGGAVYSATWTPHTYTVVLDPQGGELTGSAVMSDLEYGVVYSIEQIPMRVGYSFVGWMNSETGDITVEIKDLCDINGGEVVFNAVWLPISYNVIFQTQFEIDGELVIIANQAAVYGESFRLAVAPARTGYIFAGWEAEDGSVYVSEGLVQNLSTMNEDTVVLTAKWMPIHYTIVFEDCDVEKVEMNYEGTYTLPTSKKNGYVLTGWQIVVNGVSQLYKIGDTVKNLSASDGDTVEVWAKWTRVTQMEGVTFRFDSYYADANGGLSLLPIHLESIDPNVPFKLPVAIKPGYEFVGWLDKETGTEYPKDTLISDLSAFKAQVNLTAVFSPADYTITFWGVSSTTYTVESMPIPPAVPAWKGYIGSWNIPENPIGDIVVYPVYTPITYTIVLDPTEGEINRTMIRVQYDTQVVLGTPTRSGYVFKGWTYNGNLYEGDLLLDMTLTDLDGETITLQAVWEEDVPVYTATFVVDGRVLTTMEFTEADLIRGTLIMPKVTPKAHYDGRWSIESLPAANVTVQAIYTPVLYSITFVANGHTETVMYYTVEAPLDVLPAVPFKTGYMNEKWESFAMDGGDLVVNAEYTPINYRVMIDSMNGAEILEVSATYDTEFTLPEIPVREGWSFRGWYMWDGKTVIEYNANEKALNLADTNGAVVTIAAVWTANVYQMTFDSVADKTVEFTVMGILDMDKIPEIPAGLERACYSASWAIPDTLPATDITIYARYTEIEYKIVFDHLEELTGVSPKEVSWNISMGSLQEESFGDGYVWSLDRNEYVPYDLIRDLPETENDEDNYTLVLYPVLKKYAYTVTFGYDSKNVILIKNINAVLMETITLAVPDVPFKTGYIGEWVFTADDGYALEPGENNTIDVTRLSENAATNLTVKVIYTPIQYTVRYDLAGGELAEGNTPADLLANYDGSYFVMDMVPSRVGYDFAGWVYTDADGNETVLAPASNSIINLTTVNHDVVVLKAKWVARQYAVVAEKRYNAGDRFKRLYIVLFDSVAYDAEIILPNVAPEHYEQTGWMINGEFYEINTVFKNLATGGTVTVEPVLRGKEHTVDLYADGVCVGTVKYRYGDDTYAKIVEEIYKVQIPEKAFYEGEWSIGLPHEYLPLSGEVTIFGMDEFSGNGNNRNYIAVVDNNGAIWVPTIEGIYDEMFGSMIHDPHEYGVIFPKTITAEYIPVIYDVEFMVDGMIVKKDSYTVESPAEYPALPAKEHYTAAWDIDTLPGGDVTVTAVYTPIVYTVTFVLPDGTVVDISRYTVEDKTVHMPAVPYGYDAWDITPLVGGDVTVYALKKNDPDPIILTFVDSLGNRVGAVTVEEGKQLPPLPTVPEIRGYVGSWKIPETVTESMTVYPEYELIEYRVYFYDENGDIVTVVGKDGQARDYATYTILNHSVTIPSVPFKDYYRGRWDIPALTTGDVEVYAVYEPIVYKVTFLNPDMSVYDVRVFTIENMIVEVPKGPAYVGHTFTHWSTTTSSLFDRVFSGVISDAENFTVYPKYSVNTYSITYVPNGGTINDWIYDSTYTVKDSISVPTDVLYHKYSDFNHFLGWYYDPSCTRPFDNDELKRNPRNVTLYAKWDLIDHYYIGIDNTPWSPGSGRVVIDWSKESDTKLNNHNRPLDSWNQHRKCDMDVYNGTKEIYFIGSPEKLYDSFKLIFCQFAEGQNITIHFVNFWFMTNGCGLTTYDSASINLTIDVIGECMINARSAQSTAIEMGHCNITFEGDGILNVYGGDGTSATTASGSGNAGCHAVNANNVTIDMEGDLYMCGGNGGGGSNGNAGSGSGSAGGSGGSGGSGGDAIKATEVTIIQGSIILVGGYGGDGASGGKGNSGGVFSSDGAGGNGGAGGAGGDAIEADKVTIYSSAIPFLRGGDGGDGGDGGNAGTGGWKEPSGGSGGAAGAAGKAIKATTFSNLSSIYNIGDGNKGEKGTSGKNG